MVRPLIHFKAAERGVAMLVVLFVMVVILAGGLAAVALTSGELASARGSRTREITEACASQALRRLQTKAIDPGSPPSFSDSAGTLTSGSSTLDYRAGHYDSGGASTVRALDSSKVDMTSLYEGENITNLVPGGAYGLQVVAATATCKGSGFGEREVEVVYKTGAATGSR